MKKTVYIVDGYNVIHRVPRWERLLENGLQEAREGLLAYCARWTSRRGDAWLIYVVFDGQSDVANDEMGHGDGVRAVYTRTGEEADERILSIVRQWGSTHDYVVVSDDRYVAGTAKRLGARLMGAAAFAAVAANPAGGARRGPSGDYSHAGKELGMTAKDAKALTEELAREWGAQ